MKRTKNKGGDTQGKNQPVSINISFNINPKSILNHEEASQMKVQQNIYHSNSTKSRKNSESKKKKQGGECHSNEVYNLSSREKDQGLVEEADLSMKQMENIKKTLFEKLSNIDIVMPPPLHKMDLTKELNQSQWVRQSMMSDKLEDYDEELVSYSSKGKDLDLKSFDTKSKILKLDLGKIKQFQRQKLQKSGKGKEKKSISSSHSKFESKFQSKLSSHRRTLSTITEIKHSGLTKKRKKSKLNQIEESSNLNTRNTKKQKEDNLKEKLQQFKMQVNKLAQYYSQNEVLNTKLSSQLYNMVSKEVSKQLIANNTSEMSVSSQGETIQEIRYFQGNKGEYETNLFGQQLIIARNLYSDLRQKEMEQYQKCELIKTESIVQCYQQSYYQKFATDELLKLNLGKKTEDIMEKPLSTRLNNNKNQEIAVNPCVITSLLDLVQQNLGSNGDGIAALRRIELTLREIVKDHIISQYSAPHPIEGLLPELNKYIQTEKNRGTNIQSCTHSIDSIDYSVGVEEIDSQVNNQFLTVISEKNRLLRDWSLKDSEIKQLESWQSHSKEQLIKVKSQVWKQYKKIKEIVEDRIISQNGNLGQIISKQSKKRKKMMKCLSDRYLNLQSKEKKGRANSQEATFFKNQNLKKFQLDLDKHLSKVQSLGKKQVQSEPDVQKNLFPSTYFQGNQTLLASDVVIDQPDNQCYQSNSIINLMSQPVQPISMERELISQEDKEDIFEFIFLDLCIELYQQALEYKHKKKQKNGKFKDKQVGCSRIMTGISNFIKKQKKLSKIQIKRIGISTSFSTIRQYLQKLIRCLLREDQESKKLLIFNPNNLLKKINSPLGPTQIQIIKSLRISIFQTDQNDNYDQDFQDSNILVIEPQLFIQFQNKIIKINQAKYGKYYDSQQRQTQRTHFLRSCSHIHHKAIFDCLNQSLDYQRIYGIWGKPFIWTISTMSHHLKDIKQLGVSLDRAANDVLSSAAFACGLMATKQESLIKDIPADSAYLKQLQDDRMVKLLQDYIRQVEDKWFFHEDQIVEILLEISHIVWAILLKETAMELEKFMF